jgi:gamma-glutamyltranspeptidase/glutathione hydrolase
VFTIDGRETAPASMRRNSFIDPDTGSPYPFFPDLVTSGVSVGVPGTPMLMDRAIRRFGNGTLAARCCPPPGWPTEGSASTGPFHLQTSENAERFRAIRPTRRLFLVDGQAPAVGTVFRNPDLADTYRLLARRGVDALYKGALAQTCWRRSAARPRRSPPTCR